VGRVLSIERRLDSVAGPAAPAPTASALPAVGEVAT
jgi:hypothetical protein